MREGLGVQGDARAVRERAARDLIELHRPQGCDGTAPLKGPASVATMSPVEFAPTNSMPPTKRPFSIRTERKLLEGLSITSISGTPEPRSQTVAERISYSAFAPAAIGWKKVRF